MSEQLKPISNLIDLSEVRDQKTVQAVPENVTLNQMQECMTELKTTARALLDAKFGLLQQLGEVPTIPGLVGVKNPGEELVHKLKFIDNNMTRVSDLIYACGLVMIHKRNQEMAPNTSMTGVNLSNYPIMKANVEEVGRMILKAVTEPEGETPHLNKLMIFGFAELVRKHEQLDL